MLAACSTNPHTGRDQFLAVPALQAAQADIGAALTGGAQARPLRDPCTPALRFGPRFEPVDSGTVPRCAAGEQTERFSRQVERIGAELAGEARTFSPGVFQRIASFQIGVYDDADGGTGSNSRGRIALSSELARLEPTDDVVAFLIAREMGHVIARHDEEDAGVRMAFSALTALVPGGSLIAKFAASTLGSLGLTRNWAAQQRREADEIALALLERTDRSRAAVALNLRAGLSRAHLRAGGWSDQFGESIERVNLLARAPSQPASPVLVALRKD
jgi:hypothetical protein